MDNRPIGVFDSGLGGLTGVRELRKRLPHEDIIYFGDTGRVPYGSRSPETILQYARQDVAFLLSKDVKCIMAACGTVSSTYPAAEAARLPVPYLGVVDAAAREAAFSTRNRRIGVIGTAATIRSRSYEKLLRQLRRVLPGEDIIYFGDTGRVPYGSRGREIIRQYARQDIRFLLSHDVKFIIAACGTVSSTYPPEEAARLPVPFTGVVGATARAAVDATRNGKVGIIGTAATVRSGSYAAVIKDMKPETEIVARACPMFVPLVENGYVNDGNPVTKLIIAEYLQEVKDAGVDTLILGCTHYPLLKKMIGDFMGGDVTLIDSGKVTAQAAAAALADLGLLNGRTEGGNAHYYVSDTPDNFDELEHRFLGEYAGGPVEQIAIETY